MRSVARQTKNSDRRPSDDEITLALLGRLGLQAIQDIAEVEGESDPFYQ